MGIINEVRQKVKDAMEQYSETKKRFNDEIVRIEDEITKHNEIIKETRKVLELKVMELEDTTAEERKIEEATVVIKRLTERLELVKRGKRQALASIVPAVKSYLNDKREAVKDEIEAQRDVINRKRAELLKEIQVLFAIDAKAIKLYAELNAIAEENGERVPYGNGSFLEGRIHITDNWAYSGKDSFAAESVTVPYWMVQDAKKGIIPQPLRKYFG